MCHRTGREGTAVLNRCRGDGLNQGAVKRHVGERAKYPFATEGAAQVLCVEPKQELFAVGNGSDYVACEIRDFKANAGQRCTSDGEGERLRAHVTSGVSQSQGEVLGAGLGRGWRPGDHTGWRQS